MNPELNNLAKQACLALIDLKRSIDKAEGIRYLTPPRRTTRNDGGSPSEVPNPTLDLITNEKHIAIGQSADTASVVLRSITNMLNLQKANVDHAVEEWYK